VGGLKSKAGPLLDSRPLDVGGVHSIILGIDRCRTSVLEEAKREKATGHRNACILVSWRCLRVVRTQRLPHDGYIRTSPCWALRKRLEALERRGLQAVPPPIDLPLRFAERCPSSLD
jgi:hypothetical protein